MHERSLLTDLLRKIEFVARENDVARVLKVKVKLGAHSHIFPGHFREHFDKLSEGQRQRVRSGFMVEVAKHGDNGVIRVPAKARVGSGRRPGT